ncbi:MAG: hypothetical protein H7Z16_05940 [Pyrinomonadaceae bacterium]|nr:hypothetical protein [Pyrinomonadaceae bacterium]
MKYLVVAALLTLLLILVYSRVRPYLTFLKKILGSLNAMVDSSAQGGSARRSATRVESKLVRCVSCGTWVPADRAVGSQVGASTYCSRACLEKPSDSKERKIAG